MLSAEKIDEYRRMTPRERWREVEQLLELGWQTLLALPAAERQRRLDIIRAEHEASDREMLARLRSLR